MPRCGMLPADQRLDAVDLAAVDLGLIVEQELVGLERLAQVVLQGSAGIDGGLQSRSEEAHGIAACRLGLIHGDVSLLHHLAQGSRADLRRR